MAFLQGQLTQDVRGLAPGSRRPAAGLTRAGQAALLRPARRRGRPAPAPRCPPAARAARARAPGEVRGLSEGHGARRHGRVVRIGALRPRRRAARRASCERSGCPGGSSRRRWLGPAGGRAGALAACSSATGSVAGARGDRRDPPRRGRAGRGLAATPTTSNLPDEVGLAARDLRDQGLLRRPGDRCTHAHLRPRQPPARRDSAFPTGPSRRERSFPIRSKPRQELGRASRAPCVSPRLGADRTRIRLPRRGRRRRAPFRRDPDARPPSCRTFPSRERTAPPARALAHPPALAGAQMGFALFPIFGKLALASIPPLVFAAVRVVAASFLDAFRASRAPRRDPRRPTGKRILLYAPARGLLQPDPLHPRALADDRHQHVDPDGHDSRLHAGRGGAPRPRAHDARAPSSGSCSPAPGALAPERPALRLGERLLPRRPAAARSTARPTRSTSSSRGRSWRTTASRRSPPRSSATARSSSSWRPCRDLARFSPGRVPPARLGVPRRRSSSSAP